MPSRPKSKLPARAALSFRTTNKSRRQELYVDQKKARGADQRAMRFARRKAEEKDAEAREKRLRENKPVTLEHKRAWDGGDDDGLGMRVDVERLKRRRVEAERAGVVGGKEEEEEGEEEEADDVMGDEDDEEEENNGDDEGDDADTRDGVEGKNGDSNDDDDDDNDSMLGSNDQDSDDDAGLDEATMAKVRAKRALRDSSAAPSTTSTNLDLTPSSLARKFPNLFSDAPPPMPKILVTTSLNSTLHDAAGVFCTLLPNSNYVRRSAHRYAHKYSLREICRFSANREYTHVVLLREDQKKVAGLTVVCLPAGPTFTFSVTNFVEGKKLPGHGRPTNHYPELLLK
jgi:ribosome production factor 1